jgi:hypothetical protein
MASLERLWERGRAITYGQISIQCTSGDETWDSQSAIKEFHRDGDLGYTIELFIKQVYNLSHSEKLKEDIFRLVMPQL